MEFVMFGELLDLKLLPNRVIMLETLTDSDDIVITYGRIDLIPPKRLSCRMSYGFCKDAPSGFLQQFIDDLEERCV